MAKPRVALVAYQIEFRYSVPRTLADLVTRLHDRIDFVAVSAGVAPELQPLLEWRRVPTSYRTMALRSGLFFVNAPRVLRTVDADLVHAMMALVPNRVDVATVHWLYTAMYRAEGDGPRLKRAVSTRVERWAYGRRARVLTAPSEPVRRDLEELFPGVPVVLTPDGVDFERFSPDPGRRAEFREEQGARDGDVVALFVGNVNGSHGRAKGLEAAITGFARARESIPELGWLWVLGFPRGSTAEELAQELGVGDRVRVFGFRDDAERFYAGADVFVLPSAYETFSRPAVEAAATGIPLVATRTGAIAELLEEGDAGIAVEPTASDVARALVRLAGDPDLRGRMGEAARRRAARYTVDAAADAVLRLYRELLDARA